MVPIYIVLTLAVACAVMMLLERRGVPTTLQLSFKGDVKRETRFLAQYGQLVCTFFTALLVWQIDRERGLRICEALWSGVIGVTIVGTICKRVLGRARPRSEHAGKFLGPSLGHANYRESFPSTHSASAVAYAAVLAYAYPQAAITFWILALLCAGLRYVMDAHWPSDVLGGIALGYLGGIVSWRIFF
ncbi:MAG TPA: phosphatase PAP2 family protein [Tepidisphaeraceae bacterium]|jgi:membrane-associated phospholipid phosphatase|nr:phosphatase PAP2 family protein [Tepidisphaeraceae bacterium]